ncbi:MAG: glycosyltransferase [Ilumatobacter sp.]
MEPETVNAPPVVAVVVVHEPGDWFEESLDAFADQDYPSLRFLFLITGTGAGDADDALGDALDVGAVIEDRLPGSFVRHLGSNPGYGPALNEVTRLVEGQNGFFLFCHDDVAPDPSAVRVMVEELYRSNAGVVAPKIVEWDDPGVLASVGLGLDRFGEVSNPIEAGEVDQEQHDGVRDVFVAPGSCMLVRADLFRELGGFDPALHLHGEDAEFCWRVHHSGARVVVAPSARVRHRGAIRERRPDMNHVATAARHRLRGVATLTGGARLPLRLIELVAVTLGELIVGLFTGRFRQGLASTRGVLGLIPRVPAIVARRRVIAPMRRVPEREVLGLQERGSARLTAYLRGRDTTTYVGAGTNVRRWRESTTAPVLAWIAVLALFVLGSRSLFVSGVPAVGEFLKFPESPSDMLGDALRAWNPTGTGATSSNPTGLALLPLMSVATLFRMGLLHTLFILGLVVVGLVGLWKLATVFPSTRARIAALAVYAASPLVGGALAAGSLDVLITYATVPWFLHALRRAVGVETADPNTAQMDIADGLIDLPWPERARRTAQVALVVALGAAFDPVVVVVVGVITVLLAIGTLVALAPWRTAARYALFGSLGVLGGVAMNLPWAATWRWAEIAGPSPIGDPGRGLRAIASFEIGPGDFLSLSMVLYLPVIAGLLLARAWRLTWAVRAGVLVVAFGALAVAGDRGSLPVTAPPAGVLLVPVAVGLAVAGAAALAAFDLDVRGGSFGWRQPLGLAASAAIVIGIVPGVLAVGSGDWDTPSTPLARLVGAQLPDVPGDGEGDYHVLLVGDARLIPVPATEYRDGVSFAVIDDDDLVTADRYVAPDNSDEAIAAALDQIAAGSTQRAGRLLAPLGIRYVVIPEFDGVTSTPADPLPLALGLVDSFDEQLDVVSVVGLPTVELFENSSWIPTFSQLTGATADASRSAGADALVRADLTQASPLFSGADAGMTSEDEVTAGVVHIAVPYDENWTLTVDGQSIEPRRAFGLTTAFDIEQGGTALLAYESPASRRFAVVLQVALWLVVLVAALRVSVPLARGRRPLVDDETLISLDAPGAGGLPVPLLDPGIDPGLDLTGQISRTDLEDADLPDDVPRESDVPVSTSPELPAGASYGAPTDESSGGAIDELPWVDELMEQPVTDPIDVRDETERS